MKAVVLLVEDEFSVGTLVQRYLEHEGYHVLWVRCGGDALTEFGRHPIDIVILDIGLPDMDGFDVCRKLTAASRVPIIMLTVRDQEADRVAGLEVGADDYVTKPFSPRELMARVKAVLRRAESAESILGERITVGDLSVRPASREVFMAGRPVEVTAKEYDLLGHFARNAGVVLTREQLLEAVWSLEFPGGTRTVDVHVAQLRRKLGRPEIIRTVRGVGYFLVREPADSRDEQ